MWEDRFIFNQAVSCDHIYSIKNFQIPFQKASQGRRSFSSYQIIKTAQRQEEELCCKVVIWPVTLPCSTLIWGQTGQRRPHPGKRASRGERSLQRGIYSPRPQVPQWSEDGTDKSADQLRQTLPVSLCVIFQAATAALKSKISLPNGRMERFWKSEISPSRQLLMELHMTPWGGWEEERPNSGARTSNLHM